MQIKVAFFEQDIESILVSSSLKFSRIPIGEKNVRKYGALDGGTMIMISQNSEDPQEDYNVIVTVMGTNSILNLHKLEQFEQFLPFKLRPAPEALLGLLDTFSGF
jgi:hypothetical protein